MFRSLLKSKIHRVAVTQCELHYEGYQPQLVFVDEHNRQTVLRHAVPTQHVPAN